MTVFILLTPLMSITKCSFGGTINQPPTTYQNKESKTYLQPEWLTADILKAIAKRNALRNGNELVKYKFWRNKVLSLIRISKRTFYMLEIENNRCDTRKLWKSINEIAPKKTFISSTILEVGKNLITTSIRL